MGNDDSCEYKPKKVMSEKKASKCKVGTYYHPTKESFRSGICKKGEILKKGYVRKSYVRKNGTRVKGSKVDAYCVKDTGMAGKVLSKYKVIKLNKTDLLAKYGYSTKLSSKDRFRKLIKAASHYTYSTVVKRINAIRTLSKANKRLFDIYTKDLENLKQWRKENPKKYMKKVSSKSTTKKRVSKKRVSRKSSSKKSVSKSSTKKSVSKSSTKKRVSRKSSSKKIVTKSKK